MENEKIEKRKRFNRKIYPIYKMFSWDLLFHVPIIFIYLFTVKKLSVAEIFLLDSLYMGFKVIMQMPGIIIVDRIRQKK